MQQTCTTGCGRPTRDTRLLCDHDVWRLERALAELPALLDQLHITLTRQSRFGSQNGGRSAEHPVPFDVRASELLDELRIVLVGWTLVLVEDHHQEPPPDSLRAVGRFLLARVDLLATHEAAGDIFNEIMDLAACDTGRGWRAIDLASERIYAGQCGNRQCEEDLYARPSARSITCRLCGAVHDVERRRDIMREVIDGMLFTITEIARLAAFFDGLDRGRIKSLLMTWQRRGRIVPHGTTTDGVATYPFGETLGAVMAAQGPRSKTA